MRSKVMWIGLVFVSGITASSEKPKDHRQQSTQKNKENEGQNDMVHGALVHFASGRHHSGRC
jgi:hypothetical protein